MTDKQKVLSGDVSTDGSTEILQRGGADTSPDSSAQVRWLVMQSLKHKKWVLAVIRGDFSEYQVTELMSENVELIIQYADYLNKGVIGSALDRPRRELLEKVRRSYTL